MGERLLITGCGRSGTAYMARAISAAGVKCGHERIYYPGSDGTWPDRRDAESSWMAVAHLPIEAHVVHQVREPVAWLRSWLRSWLPESRTAPQYRDVIVGVAAWFADVDGDPIRMSMRHWVDWNTRVEPHAAERIRIEDADPRAIVAMLGCLGYELSRHAVERIATVPRDANTRGDKTLDSVTWGTLPDCAETEAFAALATKYGYTR